GAGDEGPCDRRARGGGANGLAERRRPPGPSERFRRVLAEPLAPPSGDEDGPGARQARALRGCGSLLGGRLLRRRRRGGGALRLRRRRDALLTGQDTIEPGDRVLLRQVLREAQLRGEDLLRLPVPLLLPPPP